MGFGRPTKYDPEKMSPILVAILEDEGHCTFTEEIPAELGIGRSTFYKWLNPEDPTFAGQDFVDIIEAIQAKRDKWMLSKVKVFIEGDQGYGSSPILKLALANTVGWVDKQETKNENTERTITIDDSD